MLTYHAGALRARAMKKRKKENNVMMWVGIGVGAGVLLLVILIGVVVIIVKSNAGEPEAKAPIRPVPEVNLPKPPPPPPKPNYDKVQIGEGKRQAGGIRVRINRVERLNELRQIGLFYQSYRTEFNKAPQTVQQFTEYIKREANQIKQAIDEKYYVLLPNVQGGGIVAYELDPDTNQRHGVVTANGEADEISTDELVMRVKQGR
jgi:hypothetical protein